MHLQFQIHKIHFLKKELSEVYVNLALQSFAISLIAVFIPIYLLSSGFSLNSVIMFFITYYAVLGFFSPISAILANRFGFKHIILFRTPFLISFLLGLHHINDIMLSPIVIAVIGGIGSSLYWISINSIFAKHSDKIHRGRQTGNLISIPKIASLIGPTLGGVIALIYGFPLLFLITSAIIVVSVMPLFVTGETKPHIRFSLKKMIKIQDNLKYSIYFILSGPKFIAGSIFWPLFVYWGLSGSTIGTGLSQTLAGIGILLFTHYIGRQADRTDNNSLIKKGAILIALLWFIRIFATSPMEFFIYSFLAGIFTILIDIPFTAATFNQANKENPDEFIVLRELTLAVGRIFSLGILLFIPDTIPSTFFSFSLAGVTTLAFILF
ncbi:MAG: MFS transporter [Candidatus Aenigmarchaeota archaeon]|nr:MFS transporter [Candidatus Aenigmarchaeota archaeon]